MNTVNGAQASVYILYADNSCDESSGSGKVHDIFISKLPLIDIDDEKQIEELMPWSGSLPEGLKSRKSDPKRYLHNAIKQIPRKNQIFLGIF